MLAQLALRPNVPVERHGFDPEFTAERGHRRVTVRHRGLGQPHLGFRQCERPAALAAARPRGREPGQGAFAEFPLELGAYDANRYDNMNKLAIYFIQVTPTCCGRQITAFWRI